MIVFVFCKVNCSFMCLFIHACWLVIYDSFIYFRFDDDDLELSNKYPRMSG